MATMCVQVSGIGRAGKAVLGPSQGIGEVTGMAGWDASKEQTPQSSPRWWQCTGLEMEV